MSIGMPDDGPGAAIRFERVGHTYPGAHAPTLAGVDLAIPEGELCVVVGPTGSGKSTLLGAINGLVPHFTGGTLRGRVTVEGRDDNVMVGCGMGHVPERSRRFLYWYTSPASMYE